MNKRIFSITAILFLTLSLLCYRIYLLSTQGIYAASTENTQKTNVIAATRGNVYDTNLKPLTNTAEKHVALIKPTAKSFAEIERLQSEEIEKELKNGNLVTAIVPSADFFEASNDIMTLTTYERYDGNTLSHILGYCKGNDGMYGIEKYYNSLLSKTNGSLTIKYHCDALGRVLNGEAIEIHNDNYNNKSGLVLTIDKDIQKTVENALLKHNVEIGCAIVLNAKTSELLACASMPIIERKNLDASLKNPNSPFINRAFSAYPVGSVFKAVTAAAALEKGYYNFNYECNGSITKSGNVFNCNKLNGHGELDLKGALTVSCNPYFIELSCRSGASEILRVAESSGFGKACDFGNGYMTAAGNLPKKEELNSNAAIGNLGFGQGSLLATPLQVANFYAVIANNGIYNEPTLIKGYVDENNKFTAGSKTTSVRVLKSETCEILKSHLLNVVNEGTGKPAFTSLFESCGKTATAQSGRYNENGVEIKYSWYVGFFPYEDPEYVICIMKENGISGSNDCAPAFKEIGENIYILEKTRK